MQELRLRSTADIASTYGFPEATLRYWRHCGDGPPSVRIGRRVFYREHEVIDWINQQFDDEEEKRVSA